MFHAGFTHDKSSYGFSFFPYKINHPPLGDATISYNTELLSISGIKDFDRLNASSFFENQTYGIGFDVETNLIFFQSFQEVRRYQFTFVSKPIYKWYARVYESTPGKIVCKDKFSVNFGQKPFVLTVPYGFQPFIEDYKDICKTINSKYCCLNIFMLYAIIII